MGAGLKVIGDFLHENHLLALLLGTGFGASLNKIKKKLERILIKNKGNIFKTVGEVTEKISTALDEEGEDEAEKLPDKKILDIKE